jgi:NAD/NADP transhydrogenase beta subunit
MENNILQIIYLIASVTFIAGLKFLGNPATARKGNLMAAFGMVIAIFGTIFLYTTETGVHLHNLGFIFAALAVGTVVGWIVAKKVQMTAMPEMVSLFNGMGGACAMLISLIEFQHINEKSPIIILAGLIIGSISFLQEVQAQTTLEMHSAFLGLDLIRLQPLPTVLFQLTSLQSLNMQMRARILFKLQLIYMVHALLKYRQLPMLGMLLV